MSEQIRPPDALVRAARERVRRELAEAQEERARRLEEAKERAARSDDEAKRRWWLDRVSNDENKVLISIQPFERGRGYVPGFSALDKSGALGAAIYNEGATPKGLPSELTVGDTVDLIARHAEEMGEDLAWQIAAWARDLIPGDLLAAVLARSTLLADRWSLPEGLGDPHLGGDDGSHPTDPSWFALYALKRANERLRHAFTPEDPPPSEGRPINWGNWPAEAAPLAVAEWARPAMNQLFGRPKGQLGFGDLVVQKVKEGHGFTGVGRVIEGRRSLLTGGDVALLYLAEQAVEKDRRRPAAAIDAGALHHTFLSGMAKLPKHRPHVFEEVEMEGVRLELLSPDKGAIQLTLPWGGSRSLLEKLAVALREWRGPEGLRHWTAILRLLSVEGGRSGSVRWTVDDHLEALGVAPAKRTERRHRERAARLVELMTRLELAALSPDGKEWRRWPLLIVGERSGHLKGSEWALDGMVLQIHPLLYRGVRKENGKLGSNWFPAPVEVAQIDHVRFPYAIPLGVLLPIRWRLALGDQRDHLAISGAKLLELGGIPYRAREPSWAWRALDRNLLELQRKRGLGRWEWDEGRPSLAGICRLYPTEWQMDRAIYGVRPYELPPGPAIVTGDELRAWRVERSLTQAEAAKRLGVNQATISRAEGKGAEPIPQRLREAIRLTG